MNLIISLNDNRNDNSSWLYLWMNPRMKGQRYGVESRRSWKEA